MHKYKGHGLRYELALTILTGSICWINGPFTCVKMKNYFQSFESYGPLHQLDKGERVGTHNGYKALDPEFVKTASGIHYLEKRKV